MNDTIIDKILELFEKKITNMKSGDQSPDKALFGNDESKDNCSVCKKIILNEKKDKLTG